MAGRSDQRTRLYRNRLRIRQRDAVGSRLSESQSRHPVFKITALDTANKKITAEVLAANGDSTKTALAANDICRIVGTPVKENSREGDGDYTKRSISSNYNYTQIVRKDLGLINSALATKTIDQVENSISRQTEFAISEIDRDMNPNRMQ